MRRLFQKGTVHTKFYQPIICFYFCSTYKTTFSQFHLRFLSPEQSLYCIYFHLTFSLIPDNNCIYCLSSVKYCASIISSKTNHHNAINTMGATCGAGTNNLSGSHEFTPCRQWGSCCWIFSCLCSVDPCLSLPPFFIGHCVVCLSIMASENLFCIFKTLLNVVYYCVKRYININNSTFKHKAISVFKRTQFYSRFLVNTIRHMNQK